MFKVKFLLLLCLVLFMFDGCSKDIKENNITDNVINIEENNNSVVSKEEDSGNYDIDFTTYSDTMLYSGVYDLLSNQDSNIGKTIRIKGIFAIYCNEDNTKKYYAVTVQDATMCCSLGLEFLLENNENYPEEGSIIEVSGVLDYYDEDGIPYFYINVDSINLMKE